MNENIFVSQRSHARIKFQPLTTSCSIVCLSPQSPYAQIRQMDGTYIPASRKTKPCIIFPDVRAYDPDKVFKSGAANEYLSIDAGVMNWTVNGEPIAEVWSAGTDYEITLDANDTRGTLRVYRDLMANEQFTLRFSGKFLDWRTGLLYPVVSNDITLTCTEKGEDHISCSVDKPVVAYDAVHDKKLLNDYLTARSLPTVSGEDDGKGYIQTIMATLVEGNNSHDALPEGITMQLAYVGNEVAIVPNRVDCPEVVMVSYPYIRLDMRLIVANDYEVRFVREGKTIASASFSALSHTTMPANGKPLFSADIPTSSKVYRNRVLMNFADRKVDYPELYFSIRWETQARKETKDGNGNPVYMADDAKTWQRGERIDAPLSEIGIGNKKETSYFDVMFSCAPHEVGQVLGNGIEPLTDENDEFLIV